MRRPTVSLKLEAGVAPIRPTADSGYLNDEADWCVAAETQS
jgi:hypothetical protein